MEELSTLSFGNIHAWTKYFHMLLLMSVSQHTLRRIFWFLEKSHTRRGKDSVRNRENVTAGRGATETPDLPRAP